MKKNLSFILINILFDIFAQKIKEHNIFCSSANKVMKVLSNENNSKC